MLVFYQDMWLQTPTYDTTRLGISLGYPNCLLYPMAQAGVHGKPLETQALPHSLFRLWRGLGFLVLEGNAPLAWPTPSCSCLKAKCRPSPQVYS